MVPFFMTFCEALRQAQCDPNYYLYQKLKTMQHIIDRFISYVTIDTESDPNSSTTPSTKKQFDLAINW